MEMKYCALNPIQKIWIQGNSRNSSAIIGKLESLGGKNNFEIENIHDGDIVYISHGNKTICKIEDSQQNSPLAHLVMKNYRKYNMHGSDFRLKPNVILNHIGWGGLKTSMLHLKVAEQFLQQLKLNN